MIFVEQNQAGHSMDQHNERIVTSRWNDTSDMQMVEEIKDIKLKNLQIPSKTKSETIMSKTFSHPQYYTASFTS